MRILNRAGLAMMLAGMIMLPLQGTFEKVLGLAFFGIGGFLFMLEWDDD